MALYTIIVEFDLKAGAFARFHDLVVTNANASLRDEPGCRRFDVLVPEDETEKVVLYEIYDDEDAFQAHLASDHYKVFAGAIEGLEAARRIYRFRLSNP